MTKNEAARKIDSVEDVMMAMETAEKPVRKSVMRWLQNLNEDIESFLREYADELYDD